MSGLWFSNENATRSPSIANQFHSNHQLGGTPSTAFNGVPLFLCQMKIISRFGCSTQVYRDGFRSIREAVEAVSFVTDEYLGRMKRLTSVPPESHAQSAFVLSSETVSPLIEVKLLLPGRDDL